MSLTRIVFLVLLILVVGGYALYTSPGSYGWMVLTGRCRGTPHPAVCDRDAPRQGFMWFTPKR